MELAWLSPLYNVVGHALAWIHAGLSFVLPHDSGWAWGLSIVLLTVAMRIILFPLFVKQMNTQRKMQDLQPQIQKVRERYKHDKQRQQQEQMKLFQESGTNPMMGCLPILLQMPVFFALFQVLRSVAEGHARYGFSQELADSAREALIFGAPVAATFTMPADVLQNDFGASPILAKVVIAVACAIMGLTTFLTMRQGIKRSMSQMPDNPMMQPQKIMMYLAPGFGLFGLAMPVGVLIYWVSNNVWTMAQQHYLYKRNPIGGKSAKDDKSAEKSSANGRGTTRGADTAEDEAPKIERRQPRKQPRAKRRPK
ncbi:membrane protein insertase YidC [Spiractinospora alimapuensis]|uniref:membrane protein insertase YidC n=1 Tax=Spiractinospora alimapuensis TaxID=2820884 RepID=UPI001F3D836C|nr:membrane protein insertase YidC [Spiractinospora alimapuensis]QVQ54964.1 membrane protein insertase YidC [Spiractinospora alimapuensis]